MLDGQNCAHTGVLHTNINSKRSPLRQAKVKCLTCKIPESKAKDI